MKNFILRLLIIAFTSVVLFFFKKFNYYDFLVTFLLLIGLILNYKVTEEKIDVISNYIFWIAFVILIHLFKKNDIFNLNDPLMLVLILKTIVLSIYYMKYRKIIITSSYLSKFWIFVLFLFLSELILNSTYGLENSCLILGVISSFETIIIILRNKTGNIGNVQNTD